MRKQILLIITTLFLTAITYAQDKYFTRTGTIIFFSETPIENIEATNHQVSSLLNMDNGEIAVSAQIKGFEFEKALMQEHFNENYVESDKYPTATFKGMILNFDAARYEKDKDYEENIEGELTLHGVTKKITTKAILNKVEQNITGKTEFTVAVNDFGIKIPKTVINNIAENISVIVNLKLEPYIR